MTHCPGSDGVALTGTMRGRNALYPGLGVCRFCRREYKLRWGDGLIRKHRGLPPRSDGGCPYVCDPECDFSCYQPKVSDAR